MSKVFGNAIYTAKRVDGILHVAASGQKPYLQTKVSLEELPFHIWPPELGLFFETDGIANPVVLPFDIEAAFPRFPKNRKSVAIQDSSGLHRIDIVDVPKPHPPTLTPAGSQFLVYRQITNGRLLIVATDRIVPGIFIKVFGPASLEQCQDYVRAHTPTGEIDLVPDTLKAWINAFPGPGAQSKLMVKVDAFVHVGWKVRLVRAVPQGINPTILLLKFEIELPPGPVHSDAIMRETLDYEEEAAPHQFVSVTIENGSESASAPVETAQ